MSWEGNEGNSTIDTVLRRGLDPAFELSRLWKLRLITRFPGAAHLQDSDPPSAFLNLFKISAFLPCLINGWSHAFTTYFKRGGAGIEYFSKVCLQVKTFSKEISIKSCLKTVVGKD